MNERTVSIRELNQHAGKVVRSVARTGPVKVTDHGTVVAMLVPPPDERSPLERLLAEGRVEPPAADLPDLPTPKRHDTSAAQLVDDSRAER
ncbi:type II toxin-antitoxin system Phd/YefM family antitoxin [Georgenia sp. Z1491]|uniref:type II toxin-antitoxin system Phd/YefM family antitoxin n=1 Tax=Georgenia sp. Z1491 TaxID=3416707 RepID=UPI003CF442F7